MIVDEAWNVNRNLTNLKSEIKIHIHNVKDIRNLKNRTNNKVYTNIKKLDIMKDSKSTKGKRK